MKVYQKMSNLFALIDEADDNMDKYIDELDQMVEEYLPSGSGFNYGIEKDMSEPEKLIFTTSYSYQTMDEVGRYDVILDLEFIVTPNLQFGFDLEVKHLNYPELAEYYDEYFYDTWDTALNEKIDLNDEPVRLVYQQIGAKLKAIENCKRFNNHHWIEIHKENINSIISDFLDFDFFTKPIEYSLLKDPQRIEFLSEYNNLPITIHIAPSLQFGVKLNISCPYKVPHIKHAVYKALTSECKIYK